MNSEGPTTPGDDESDRLLTVAELARYLQVPVATVYAWNYTHTGPRPIHVGRWVRYRPAEVERWLDEQTVSRWP